MLRQELDGEPDDSSVNEAMRRGLSISVTKISARQAVSTEMAMEMGLIPDTRTPVAVPWHRLLRWRVSDCQRAARRKVGFWVAGVDPEAYE